MSYSREDANVVIPISKLLKINSEFVFRDEESIKPGEKWEMKIFESLGDSDVVILFWSANSSKSSYVSKEYEEAINHNKVIIPVLLDRVPLTSSLSKYQSIDMKGTITKIKANNKFYFSFQEEDLLRKLYRVSRVSFFITLPLMAFLFLVGSVLGFYVDERFSKYMFILVISSFSLGVSLEYFIKKHRVKAGEVYESEIDSYLQKTFQYVFGEKKLIAGGCLGGFSTYHFLEFANAEKYEDEGGGSVRSRIEGGDGDHGSACGDGSDDIDHQF